MSFEIDKEFPCDFPIKIMGLNNAEFEAIAIQIVFKHFPKISENAIHSRPSKNLKYLSITASVFAQNKQELDAVYLELTQHPLILMVL
ncbi:MAG: transcriptional regulator [Francisellaceae bacterium]|nr:transcriptional regulator [Francisellaceae bacterium]